MLTDENLPNRLLTGFNDDERVQILKAIDRATEIEGARANAQGMAAEAQRIEASLPAGAGSSRAAKEAHEAVAAATQASQDLTTEAAEYQRLFGLDGRTTQPVVQYVQWMRNAAAGDQAALMELEKARVELDEARQETDGRVKRDAGTVSSDVEAPGKTDNVVELFPGATSQDRPSAERTRVEPVERSVNERLALSNPELSASVTSDLSSLPGSFQGRYIKDGQRVVDVTNGEHVLTDRGRKVHLNSEFTAESVKAVLDIVEHRQWEGAKVRGTDEFRRAVWYEAAQRGIAVQGYDASPQEKAWAITQAEKAGRVNSVGENEAVKAFRESQSPEARRQAVKEHPELKKAFAAEAGFSALSKSIADPRAQEAFMKRMRENIARDLAEGVDLPDIKLRRSVTRQREELQQQEQRMERTR